MKTIYFALIFISIILAVSFVKSNEISQIPKDAEDTERLKDDIKERIIALLVGDVASDSASMEDNDSNFDKRMTYRYGKRMTYRYGKRSAMPYRFGKRTYNYDDDQLEDLLRFYKNWEPKQKRMTYRYGRSVDKQ